MPQLANQESRGFTHSFRITGAELASSGYLTSSQKTVALLPSGGIVTHAAVFQATASAGPSDLTLSVGTVSGTATNLIAEFDLDTNTDKVKFNTGSAIDAEPGLVNATGSALPIFAKFGGTVGSVTAGEWLVCLTILNPGAIASNA
jgi:hypothetical protein